MPASAPRATSVFRACVVQAIREGEALMQGLAGATRTALGEREERSRDIAQRSLVADALRLLGQHEAALVKAYPLALLEVFADGLAQPRAPVSHDSGMDFGELALVDDAEVQAQVELARAHQVAAHATDVALAELNALVSAAQGLLSVQPERNPLRPENYIRALQRVVGETGVPGEVRGLWMAEMREELARQLVRAYQAASQRLREQGVRPVGYAVTGAAAARTGHDMLGGPSGYYPTSGHGGGYGPSAYGTSMYGMPGSHFHASGAVGLPGPLSGGMPLAAQAQEALLTVGMLRQMLAGAGDPLLATSGVAVPASAFAAVAPQPVHVTQEAAEAMQDIAELERLIGRLAPGAAQGAAASAPGAALAASVQRPAAAPEPTAQDVVSRMMEHIAQDSRLLPPMQRAVQSLEPALKELVRHDTRFFTDEQHPARRLLDELTQRSLAFDDPEAPAFSRFMRLVNEVVDHLVATPIQSAAPFERVMQALEKAWATQERQRRERREARAREQRERAQREELARSLADSFARLPGAGDAPTDLYAFVTGPWARVVARAQLGGAGEGDGDDPGGYLGLVPLLLVCGQEEALRAEPERLAAELEQALPRIVEALQAAGEPEQEIGQLQRRLGELLQRARERAAARDAAPLNDEAPAAPEPAPYTAAPPAEGAESVADAGETEQPSELPAAGLELQLGQWVEFMSRQGRVRTQLTWVSPQNTLFLFTAADGSTQSMTRRMIDKLAGEGSFRLLAGGQAVVDRALSRATGTDPRPQSRGEPRRA
ncbi:DUF1631 family protein, partial [Melaminivora alkalimesophila]|uniref:Uncharacterized protein DUF1631 n=1 Tax=Melaminivora alkalimesophila TaxID=1165852 RepID=A0A317RBY9_9BURK